MPCLTYTRLSNARSGPNERQSDIGALSQIASGHSNRVDRPESDDLCPHGLRHTSLTALVAAGVLVWSKYFNDLPAQ